MTTRCSGLARNPDRTLRPCRNWPMRGQVVCWIHGGLRSVSEQLDDGGLPRHLPMGVDADGNGPVKPGVPHHRVCWCPDPDCIWTVALTAERRLVAEEIAAAIEKWRDEAHGTEWTAAHACHNGDALLARQVGGVSTASGLGSIGDET